MLRTYKVSFFVPNSIMQSVSVLGSDDAATYIFPKVTDRVVDTLEKSKLIKRVRLRVYRSDDGFSVSSSVRTHYPKETTEQLYNECVQHALAKEIELIHRGA